MQKALEKLMPDEPQKPQKHVAISAPRFAVMTVPIKNAPGSPLVIHAFSAKSRQMMREAQEAGSIGKKKPSKMEKRACIVQAVDLFCGAGGLTRGLEKAGIDVRLGVDFDPACEYPYSGFQVALRLPSIVSAIFTAR